MPWIYLDATTKKNTYDRNANVTEKVYESCKLFKCYIHIPKNRVDPEDIKVYKKYTNFFSNFVTLQQGRGQYLTATVSQAHVYYNVFDTNHQYPLILVILFAGRDVKNRYYKRSEFDPEIDGKRRRNIEQLSEYKSDQGDKQLLESLIEENANVKRLTYEIDKKDTSHEGNGTQYNKKVKVKKLVYGTHLDSHLKTLLNLLSSKNFTIHRHEPERAFGQYQSFFTYNNHPPIGSDGQPISEFQNNKYNLSVYYNDHVDVPLLLEFNRGGHSYQTSMNNLYYYHRKKDDDSMYWQKIERGHALNVYFMEHIAIFLQLTTKDNEKFIKILTQSVSELRRKLYIMVDNKNEYSKNTISQSFSKSTNYRLINNSTNIMVSDKTPSNGKCFSGTNFKVYVHDFTNLVTGIQSNEKVLLKFIIPSTDNKYNELKLYNSYSITEDEENLYYNIDRNNLYVFFYGSDDPRPLLLCYDGSAYSPNNTNRYSTVWYKAENIINCICQKDDGIPKLDVSDKPLLNALSRVVKFSNEISLDKRPSKMTQKEPNKTGNTQEQELYDAQTYKTQKIQIKVTYANKTCYRLYKHEPNGTDGQGADYRLGNIKHGDDNLIYSSQLPLSSVSVYYSVYDQNHSYPLLVALEFKANSKNTSEYYKLTNKSKPYNWTKIKSSGEGGTDGDDASFLDNINDLEQQSQLDSGKRKKKLQEIIEKQAYKIRDGLGIKVENYENHLFDPKDCKEEDKPVNIPLVVGAPLGAAAVIGTGITIRVVVTKKLAAAL